MTTAQAVLAIGSGFVAGLLSGLFGVGGGTVMTPAVQVLLGAPPIVALATPLPAILPTAATGAWTYRRSGEIDERAALWMAVPGVLAATAGAALTKVVNTHLLLVVTAAIIAYQAAHLLRGTGEGARARRGATASGFVATGLLAGFVSGLLGIGGGIVMVPLLAGLFGMPLKRALGTSLLAIVILVIPGTIVHAALGHIDWAIFAALTIGAVPGARVGAAIALGTRERTLRILVGSFLMAVAVAYGASELASLARG